MLCTENLNFSSIHQSNSWVTNIASKEISTIMVNLFEKTQNSNIGVKPKKFQVLKRKILFVKYQYLWFQKQHFMNKFGWLCKSTKVRAKNLRHLGIKNDF